MNVILINKTIEYCLNMFKQFYSRAFRLFMSEKIKHIRTIQINNVLCLNNIYTNFNNYSNIYIVNKIN